MLDRSLITKREFIVFSAEIEVIENELEILSPANPIEQDKISLCFRRLENILQRIEKAGKPRLGLVKSSS